MLAGKTTWAFLLLLAIPTPAFADPGAAPTPSPGAPFEPERHEPTSIARPNAISVEGLGRGALYSLDYDRSLGQSVALGVGFEYLSESGGGSTTTVTNANGTTTTLGSTSDSVAMVLIPVYFNYYFAPDWSRFYLTAGADIVTAAVNVGTLSGGGAGVLFTGGAGWEYRGEGGFLFRVAAYVLAGTGGILPWGGLSLGATF